MSLLLFEIIASYFCNSLYKASFVSFDIIALLNGICLWICKLLGINTEVSGIGQELLQILCDGEGRLSVCGYGQS